MDKATANSQEELRSSISDLYANMLAKRHSKKEAKLEERRLAKEKREQEKLEEETKEDGAKLSKKEKRQLEIDNWKEIVVGLTGDDLEYSSKKAKKKKYRKWIDDDEINAMLDQKKKKVKKKNYNKEFEPELNVLRNLLADQNKFTADLQKRFQNAIGPATKDAMAPNKTMVELANVISSGRSNALGMAREIGSIKKTIAELYMKQKKLDSELGSGSISDAGDIGLMGSNIAASMLTNPLPSMDSSFAPISGFSQPIPPVTPSYNAVATPVQTVPQVDNFDPASWSGPSISGYTAYENIPHSIVVEKNRTTGDMRYKAIRDDNGEELVGCPLPTSDLSRLSVNETDMTVKGSFDEIYPLRYIE